jgi:TP901 family phage tail tape measure protein
MIGFGFTISLNDNFSSQASHLQNSFQSLQGAGNRFASGMGEIMANIGASLTASVGNVVSEAINTAKDFSDKYGDVMKTTGMAFQEVKDLTTRLSEIDTRTSLEGLLEISAVAGQFGVAKDQVFGFTAAIDKLGVAFQGEIAGGTEGIATNFSKLRNVLTDMKTGNIGEDLLKIGNAFNVLSAEGTASSAGLSNFTNRIAGIGITLGLRSSEVLGFSATLEELNVSAERGGTALTETLSKMASSPEKFAKVAGVGVNEFKNMVNTDLYGAFKSVLAGTNSNASKATEFASVLNSLGLSGSGASEVFAKLSNNLELLDARTRTAKDSLSEQASILAEFDTKNNTLAGRMEKAGKAIRLTYLNLGEALEPALSPLMNTFAMATKEVALFIKTDIAPFIQGIVDSSSHLMPVFEGAWASLKAFGNEVISTFQPIGTYLSTQFERIANAISKTFNFNGLDSLESKGKRVLDMVLIPFRVGLAGINFAFQVSKPLIDLVVGAFDGLMSTMDWIIPSFNYAKDAFSTLISQFDTGSSSFDGLAITGQILGKVIGGVLTGAFYLVGGAIHVVSGIIQGTMSAINFLIEGFQTLFEWADKLFAGGLISKGLEAIGGKLSSAFGLGFDDQEQQKQKIESVTNKEEQQQNSKQKIQKAFEVLKPIQASASQFITGEKPSKNSFVTENTSQTVNNTQFSHQNDLSKKFENIKENAISQKSMQIKGNGQALPPAQEVKVTVSPTPVYLDGELITKNVNERQQLEGNRK